MATMNHLDKRASLALQFLALVFSLCCSSGVNAQTGPAAQISISPLVPTSEDVIQITVVTGRSCYPATPAMPGIVTEVSGTTVQIRATLICITFTPPPAYTFTVPVGPLPRGNYTVQYIASLTGSPPALYGESTFQVGPQAAGVPTLISPPLIGVMSLLLACGLAMVNHLSCSRMRPNRALKGMRRARTSTLLRLWRRTP